jgi:hypothetical protein
MHVNLENSLKNLQAFVKNIAQIRSLIKPKQTKPNYKCCALFSGKEHI